MTITLPPLNSARVGFATFYFNKKKQNKTSILFHPNRSGKKTRNKFSFIGPSIKTSICDLSVGRCLLPISKRQHDNSSVFGALFRQYVKQMSILPNQNKVVPSKSL